MFITSSLLLVFTCSRLLRECVAEEVYALVRKEAKLYFDYNQPWNKSSINKDGDLLASLTKTSTDKKITSAIKDGIYVNYIKETNQGLVTIQNVSSAYNGTVTMNDATSGNLLKKWHLHVLERPPANPKIISQNRPMAGHDYHLTCSGDSLGVSKYKWYKGGQLITPDARYTITGSKLTIRDIRPADSANLTCVIVVTDDIQSNRSDIFFVDVSSGSTSINTTSQPRQQVTETTKLTEPSTDTSQKEGGISGLSSGARSRDSNLLALFFTIQMISILSARIILFK